MSNQIVSVDEMQEEPQPTPEELWDRCNALISAHEKTINEITLAKAEIEEATVKITETITSKNENAIKQINASQLKSIEKFEADYSKIAAELKTFAEEFESDSASNTKKHTEIINGLETRFESELGEMASRNETSISSSLKKIKDDYGALKIKIEALLPEALAVGLASSFKDEMKFHRSSSLLYSAAFMASVMAMVAVPCLLYHSKMINLSEIKNIEELFYTMVRIAAFEWPLVWLANLLSRKASQQQRIYEEYAHKYTAAMTYVGMRSEFMQEGASAESKEFMEFTKNFIRSVFLNPSSTLDKKVETQNPIENVIQHVHNTAEKIAETSQLAKNSIAEIATPVK